MNVYKSMINTCITYVINKLLIPDCSNVARCLPGLPLSPSLELHDTHTFTRFEKNS